MSKQDDTLAEMAQAHEDERAQAVADKVVSLERAKDRHWTEQHGCRDLFTVTIDISNSAFDGEQGRHELARILEGLADRVKLNYYSGNPTAWREDYSMLQDFNGNTVGKATTERTAK